MTELWLLWLHSYNIPALLDIAADAGFCILVPFAMYFFTRR